MANEYAAPINHTATSAAATVAGGAASGLVKGGLKTAFKWIAGCTVAIGLGSAIVAGAYLGIGAAIGLGLLGAVGGGVLGLWSSPWAGAVGGLLGGFKGGERASDRVHQEQGAASMLQAQVDVARDQIIAQSQEAAQNSQTVAPSNSMMNAANTKINVGQDVQYDGVVNDHQLAYGRA